MRSVYDCGDLRLAKNVAEFGTPRKPMTQEWKSNRTRLDSALSLCSKSNISNNAATPAFSGRIYQNLHEASKVVLEATMISVCNDCVYYHVCNENE
jgi:hypothetical protein